MPKLIITTVGTSIIYNTIYNERSYGNAINSMRNEINPKNYDAVVTSTTQNLTQAVERGRKGKCISAEMGSLIAFKDSKEFGFDKDDMIVLFATDTVSGKFCAAVHKNTLENLKWCRVDGPITIEGFNLKDAKKFVEVGRMNLISNVNDYLKKEWTKVYFNITGGYKGIIPFATKHAFEKGISLIYLYEDESSELVIITSKNPKDFSNLEVVAITVGSPA